MKIMSPRHKGCSLYSRISWNCSAILKVAILHKLVTQHLEILIELLKALSVHHLNEAQVWQLQSGEIDVSMARAINDIERLLSRSC